MQMDHTPLLAQPVDAGTRPRVALLVDGDNIGVAWAGSMILRAASLGTLTVKCVVANFQKSCGWEDAPGFRLVHAGAGKNAADIRLAIEAMELAYLRRADAFAIAASDRDYTHLAQHLVERGFPVLGLGEAKTPDAFRKSCWKFHELKRAVPADAPDRKAIGPIEAESATRAKSLQAAIEGVIRKHRNPEGWIKLGPFGHHLNVEECRTRKDTGRATWKAYFDTLPKVFRCEGSGTDQRVRLVRD